MIFRDYGTYGEPCNIGDLIVEEGARNLARKAGLDLDRPDILFVIGTPWLWNLCWESDKYMKLRYEAGRFKRKVAIGIGSCFEWGGAEPDLSIGAEMVVSFWKGFELVVCRDLTAQSIVPESHCLPCPSIWYFDQAPVRPFRDILQIGCDGWHPEYIKNRPWVSQARDYWAYHESVQNSKEDIDTHLSFILSHRRIISQRIHALLPACPFVETKCVPADSRALSCIRAGIGIWPEEAFGRPQEIRPKRDGEWTESYLALLKNL